MTEPEYQCLADVLADVGAEGIGRWYISDLVRGLDRLRTGELVAPVERTSPENLMHDAVEWGEDETGQALPDDLRWDLVMAALHACPDDDGLLWCLGDGPFDQLRDRPGIDERLYAARDRDPKLQRLFEAMRRKLPSEGVTEGWWFG